MTHPSTQSPPAAPAGDPSAPPPRAAAPRAFTLIEVTVTIIIITLLASLAILAAHKAMKGARQAAERQILVALKQSITNFKNEFGFLPPLVHDNTTIYAESSDPNPPGPWPSFGAGGAGPVAMSPAHANALQPVTVGGSGNPARYAVERAYLEGFTSAAGNTRITDDYRFSNYSLTYYLMGVLDVPTANGGKAVDGATGPKLTAPLSDGAFSQRGKAYDASYDISREIKRIGQDPGSQFGITFNDRWKKPIRYYRWETRPASTAAAPGSPESRARTLVPRAIGDPRLNAKIRGASYALVITGEDRLTDMRSPLEVGETADPAPPLNDTVKDDIVEVEE